MGPIPASACLCGNAASSMRELGQRTVVESHRPQASEDLECFAAGPAVGCSCLPAPVVFAGSEAAQPVELGCELRTFFVDMGDQECAAMAA